MGLIKEFPKIGDPNIVPEIVGLIRVLRVQGLKTFGISRLAGLRSWAA